MPFTRFSQPGPNQFGREKAMHNIQKALQAASLKWIV
jgi:hypothetical protein